MQVQIIAHLYSPNLLSRHLQSQVAISPPSVQHKCWARVEGGEIKTVYDP